MRRSRTRRELLIRGIAAAKANQSDDAYYYLASVLKAADVVEGGFMKQANPQSNFTKNIDQTGGHASTEASEAD